MDPTRYLEVKYLKGIGPKKAELLQSELNISSAHDLLYTFPFKYIDRSRFYRINEIDASQTFIQIKGQISGFRTEGTHGRQRLIALFTDGTGIVELIWFKGINWIKDTYKTGIEYIAFGRPTVFNKRLTIAHPELDRADSSDLMPGGFFQPQYSLTEKLRNNFISSRTLQKFIRSAFEKIPDDTETLPQYLVRKLKLMPLKEALYNVHFPENGDKLKKATFRLKFEELFYIQLNILGQKRKNNYDIKGYTFLKVGYNLNSFYKTKLRFELTEAQKKVIREIRKDMGSGKQMNRLLQGDVGSGKTLVALMSMLIALDNGYQACLMAPTELLARQHYNTITRMVEGLDIDIFLLTGSTKKNERRLISEALTNGRANIIIGTHALLEDPVQFNNLGLVIIDEQHRFGVAQRAKLRDKGKSHPHVLVMTATPIPRTLAMTIYGDLDVSVINELPPGRKPVTTLHYYESKRLPLFGFMRKQIAVGRQIYVVYPLIKESEKMDYAALEEGYHAIVRAFPPPEYLVVCVHGQMKPEEREASMQLFIKGKAHIMVATTVIEVGVDIPNASVMVIESAERFGLSQLHQLRGRVGRGNDQSYCFLMSSYKLSKEGKKRLETMAGTNDGFEIAETDLKLRGPGDIEGTQQSGIPFDLRISNLTTDSQVLQYARDIANEVLDADPALVKKENIPLLDELSSITKSRIDWSRIS